MRLLLAALVGLFLTASPAFADVTITNFNADGFAANTPGRRISHHDTAGNKIDAREGNILQTGTCPGSDCMFYMYTHTHYCGFEWKINGSNWCGIKVYSSPDLINWTDRGFLIPTADWLSTCVVSTGASGCYRPHMMPVNSNGKYVFYFDSWTSNVGSAALHQYLCDTPYSGCVKQSDVAYPSGPVRVTDTGLCTDESGNGFLLLSDGSTSFNVWIVALNATYDALASASATRVGTLTGEGLSCFQKAGTYYLLLGTSSCGYCSGGAPVGYVTATIPTGVSANWSASTSIDTSNTCNGQPMETDVLTINGAKVYLFHSDLYTGLLNQGWSDMALLKLSFTGSAINTITCDTTTTITGLTASTYPTPNLYPSHTALQAVVDQSTVADGTFNDRCDVGKVGVETDVNALQTFVPTATNLAGIGLPLGISHTFSYGNAAGAQPDGTLTITITDVNQSTFVPTTPVTNGTATLPASDFKWATQWVVIPFNGVTLTAGHTYGIQLSSSDETTGCFSNVTTQGTGAATYGHYLTYNGTSWSTVANFMMMFETYSSLSPGGGRPMFGQ